MTTKEKESQLDNILIDIGEFGKYQIFVTILLMLITTVHYFSVVAYVFETLAINHRCFISGCDSVSIEYNPSWLINAVPFKDGKPTRCNKFQHMQNTSCNSWDFNNSTEETCNQFIYETSEKSIMQDFDLQCDNNVKMLAFVGTLNGIGKFIGLPIAGYFSDNFGRKKVLIIGGIATGVLGLIRSFSTSYIFFIIFEVLDSFACAGMYGSIYVLGTELVGPQTRVLVATLQFIAFSLGGVVLGLVAWQVQSWRLLLQILYPFNFMVVFFIWLVPESVRWLLVNKKHEEARSILRKIAKINQKQIPEEKLANLSIEDRAESDKTIITLKDLFKSKILMLRCVILSFCWISGIFVYYGLTITATTLSSNHYLDFILTSLVEIPAYIFGHFVVNKIGRKLMLSGSFMLSSIACVAFIVIPINMYWVQLVLYLISKFGISLVTFVIYIATNEMFPTSLRQTLLSICSMFGRVGNILVPQLIVVQEVWHHLPLLLFAILSGISGLLILCIPETKDTILPDTIEEAENIKTRKSKSIREM